MTTNLETQNKEKASTPACLALGMVFVLLSGCTSNPVGDDKISPPGRQLSGTVQLEANGHPDRVFCWLETFALGTFTDSNGHFTLSLPAGVNNDVSGIFRLYFFTANYKLQSEEVAVKNGEFVYDEGPLNSQGKLRLPVNMVRFLSIDTKVQPASVAVSYGGDIDITVTLQAGGTEDVKDDSVTVLFPNTTAGFLGPVFFRNVETAEVFPVQGVAASSSESAVVGISPIQRSLTLPFNNLNIPPATYEVIPFLLVKHEPLPEGLLDSIGSNLETFGVGYLKLPFARTGGSFEIKP